MADKEILKKIIEDFENDKIDFENAKKGIELITNKAVEEHTLRNYYSWISLDNFCEFLIEKPIENWQDIDDELAIKLIIELFTVDLPENIFDKNTEALEKGYGKPTGFLHSLIFWNENLSEISILEELKKDNKIYL